MENDIFTGNDISTDLDELVSVEPSPWGSLSGAKVFLTGATGVFGRWMLESLLWANDKLDLKATVTVLVRDPELWTRRLPRLAKHKAVKMVTGDILSFDFPQGTFSHIVHLASPSGKVHQADPIYAFELIHGGAKRVLDLAVACGTERFLYVSSGAVYGRHYKKILCIPETCLEAPDPLSVRNSAYDEGKRTGELLCSL
ncbi:MAG: NAD-dependent epimerase/dehydratase family protein, partial [Deltaproteobacteria bacterium]|nr:NAD-dependent epimerase/dehydratase family protein [Deltaproteobacteria bacterium]